MSLNVPPLGTTIVKGLLNPTRVNGTIPLPTIQALRLQGFSFAEIAKLYGISRQALHTRAKKAGLPMGRTDRLVERIHRIRGRLKPLTLFVFEELLSRGWVPDVADHYNVTNLQMNGRTFCVHKASAFRYVRKGPIVYWRLCWCSDLDSDFTIYVTPDTQRVWVFARSQLPQKHVYALVKDIERCQYRAFEEAWPSPPTISEVA